VSEPAERRTIYFVPANFAVVGGGEFRFKSSTSRPVCDDHLMNKRIPRAFG
jgi:hypothetical protein